MGAIEFFLSRLSPGVDSARNVEVGASSSKVNTGCLTAARFAMLSRRRVAIYRGLRRPLPGLPFRRGSSRRSAQDQQGSHWPGGHLLISHAGSAGLAQPHRPRGARSVPAGPPLASAPCTMRHPPGLHGAAFKSAAPRSKRSTTARAVDSFNASWV